MKRLLIIFLLLFSIFFVPTTFAANNAFVSIVNPVRGGDFWEVQNQKPETAVLGQIAILKQLNLPATWLIRFDALDNKNITEPLKGRSLDEKGLFLEVTPTWAAQAKVEYHTSDSWHNAGSAFLTGYERVNREKLIDAAFEKFKSIFGYYPSSVGAWWIDSYSLDYMQKKYGISAGLIVADQYTTDNYQIWGQYFQAPYYPDKKNALRPAQSQQNKIPVVLSQWAARDPLNGYGSGVFESTFSVQPNDYTDYHKLGTDYFAKLISLYTNQEFNRFGSAVVGLENTYDWSKYGEEYKNQLEALARKKQSGQLSIVTLEDFSFWYQKSFPELSPEHAVIADDPLGSFRKVIWFMNPYYRAGWFYNADGSVFRDIRQYIEGDEEICFRKSCSEVNFATFATRVLDEVSFGHKWVIDEGRIYNFKVLKEDDKLVISYLNEAGKSRTIEFLPRDISVDGKISSIDGVILEAIKQDMAEQKKQIEFKEGHFNWTIFGVFSKVVKFLLFLLIVCLIPGLVLINKLVEKNVPILKRVFLALIVGSVLLTILFYITSILNLRPLIFLYILLSLLLSLRLKQLSLFEIKVPKAIDKLNLIPILVVIFGTVFQNIPTFKNGLIYPFGMGFWGPNTHDGIWHISLINQLLQGLPVENPIYAGTVLKNYHFFYDLLIAAATFFTKIPVIDLVFRFFPILFSLLLGLGTYYLIINLFSSRIGIVKTKFAAIFSLCFVYFAGSFGWIPEYLKQQGLGGESAFWANQAISFNLNPPFAVSLFIIIAFLFFLINDEQVLSFRNKKLGSWNGILVSAMLAGSLVGFKSYGAVLVIISLLFVSIIKLFKKEFSYVLIFVFSVFLSLAIFLPNFQQNTLLIIFSPFWLIHSMLDSPDRVGWVRLSLARMAGLETKNWFKFISAEALSLLIFVIGNLGFRVISFASLIKIKEIIKDPIFLFILIFSVLSFLIPILFIQSGNPWNTIQFSYYGLYTTALISGPALVYLIFRLPKILLFLIVTLVLVLMPINSMTTATYYLGFLPHGRIDSKELEALEFLSKQADGVVLTYPYDKKLKTRISEPWPLFAYDSTAYVSALSNKSVFVEDEPQNQILLTDYKKRLVASNDFFINSDNQARKKFLDLNKIKYIYLPKYFNISMSEFPLNLKTIFENEEVKIYQRT